ncbi:RHS repeat domain-containing protein [Paraburkholderia solisilvae]|uniref:Teneurin-like YD-shell domain-containing protein n=1 Tax=Paraburkholderia solisilvae TaxID=624376 RepID=A0A6J5EMM0_9BURK|nr:RHS repeat protein [Paraburkholderia solisilvae]CAB3767064.1 hypothetical protein LMG29739_04968 [Paraburkholderia solisilvae]
MAASHFSQAPSNFENPAQGNVDSRTGQYHVQLEIAEFKGNNGCGPDFSLNLQYAPFYSDNSMGLGIGWASSVSTYDRSNHLLTLDSGEQYKAIETTDGSVLIQQNPANHFIFKKISDSEYHYIQKTGEIQILTPVRPDQFYCTKKFNSKGYGLIFSWGISGSATHLLGISDETTQLCSLTYNGITTIEVWPGSSERYTVTLKFSNQNLTGYMINAGALNFTWTFEYQTVSNYTLLYKMTSPTGYQEIANYSSGIMKFPPAAGQPDLPAVQRYTQISSPDRPGMVTTYQYTTQNYLGWGGVNTWDPDNDNAYQILNEYTYGSTEIITDENNSEHRTIRTYNNYHLLVSETVAKGSCTRSTAIEYYAQVGVAFSNQPPQFQQRKKITITWTDTTLPVDASSYSEVTTTTYDEDGNKLTEQALDGKLTTWVYYSADGEVNAGNTGCPPEPNGFKLHAKSKTVTPAPSDFDDVPEEITEYQYMSIPTRDNSPVENCILLSRETVSRNGTKLLSNAISYDASDKSSPNYGRANYLESTIFDGSLNYIRKLSSIFDVQSTSLHQNITFTGFDNTSWIKKISRSRLSMRLLSAQDRLGNSINFVYDAAGRIVSRVLNPETEYENTLTFLYEPCINSNGAVSGVCTTITDILGNAEQIYVDGKNHPIRRCHNAIDAGLPTTWFDTATIEYNVFDVPARVTVTDYLDPKDKSKIFQMVTTCMYDDWGNNYELKYQSGHTQYQRNDPVSRTQTSQLKINSGSVQLGRRVTHYNTAKSPIKIDLIDSEGITQSTISYVYDGLDRLRQITDEVGNTTRYSYDVFDRASTQTLADETVVTRGYAPQSKQPQISQIKVSQGGVEADLGSQTFDGLGRVTKIMTGGRSETRSYANAGYDPSSITDNLGVTLSYQYIPELKNAVREVRGPTLSQDFTYNNQTGRPVDANENGSLARSSQWSASGRIAREQFVPTTGATRHADYTWTLLGKPLSYTDVGGKLQQATYDEFGRMVMLTDPTVHVTFAYDEAGRLVTQVATDATSSASLTTQFTYDDFGRETRRAFLTSGGETMTVERTYRFNNQFATRKTSRGSSVLRNEDFGYDKRNRLISYSCSGNEPPSDSYGQFIASQGFQYDMLGNMTQCVTTPVNGNADTATFIYDNASDPTQLTAVIHSGNSAYPVRIDLQYDSNGRMTLDEAGRTLTYDDAGRLATVSSPDGGSASYGYDANDMLVTQVLNNADVRQLYYRGQKLVNEVRATANQQSRFVLVNGGCAAVSDE